MATQIVMDHTGDVRHNFDANDTKSPLHVSTNAVWASPVASFSKTRISAERLEQFIARNSDRSL